MTVSLEFQLDARKWPQHWTLTERQIDTALRRALNKTIRWVRTQVSREVAKALSIRVGLIRDRLVVVAANASRPKAVVGLKAKQGVLPISETGNPRANARGVRVGKRQLDHAFLAAMPSGHRGVFRRRGKERLPITEVQLVLTGKIQDAFEQSSGALIERRLAQLLDQELRFVTR